ncbi:hypothetical protein D3C75_1238740 [compost metagenome]
MVSSPSMIRDSRRWWDMGTTRNRPPRRRSRSSMMYRARNTELRVYATMATTSPENSRALATVTVTTSPTRRLRSRSARGLVSWKPSSQSARRSRRTGS